MGLELMRQAGKLEDPRCEPALPLVEAKMRPDGGFYAEEKQFQASNPAAWHYPSLDWGGPSAKKMNIWLTVRDLAVLKAAGKIRF